MKQQRLLLIVLFVLLVVVFAVQATAQAAPEIVFYATGRANPVFRAGTEVNCLIEKRARGRVEMVCRRP